MAERSRVKVIHSVLSAYKCYEFVASVKENLLSGYITEFLKALMTSSLLKREITNVDDFLWICKYGFSTIFWESLQVGWPK